MQMNEKKGITLFGEIAITDMFKEYNQLDDGPIKSKPVVAPSNPDGLTSLYREKTSEAVNLIKEKCCGNIKGRTCANGSKQRKYQKPDESIYSPTRSTKALIATLVKDAVELRNDVILDVPGVFLQTTLPADKLLLMQIKDEFVDVMCEVNPEYIFSIELLIEAGKIRDAWERVS